MKTFRLLNENELPKTVTPSCEKTHEVNITYRKVVGTFKDEKTGKTESIYGGYNAIYRRENGFKLGKGGNGT